MPFLLKLNFILDAKYNLLFNFKITKLLMWRCPTSGDNAKNKTQHKMVYAKTYLSF